MDKVVKKIIPIILILSLSLMGCGSNKLSNERVENFSQVNINDLQKYKGSYVGDFSKVESILWKLPANIYKKGISLQTDKEPYGITVNYKVNESLGEEDFYNFWQGKDVNKVLEKNAIVILGLISNAENIEFNVDNIVETNYKYNRKDLEKRYGKDLESLIEDKNSLENI
ncbi:DUF4825 domain-containing protein [Clostridium sp. SHJSY1]|uniref:DUF4825 domain-containing protein n=1 Tax=Clostridium sp. SHJSY1 TaxID=2942483 RepID=UPI002874927D|nr:DUF4825 domain-containing protein [Clostridium sp. SHJSY1]MDS0526114.1 DUF4825 domain-containing protein [Clostridium sp. SHJSY1]